MLKEGRCLKDKHRLLLILTAVLLSILVQSGTLGNVDTTRRLQVSRWIWANEPPVAIGDEKDFGILGRDGKYHAWYGLGQSLVMIPLDIIGTTAIHASQTLSNIDDKLGGKLREAFVAYCLASLLSVGAILVAERLLKALGFESSQSRLGALALILGTTFLHYLQDLQENNLLLLLSLTGLMLHHQWLLSDKDTHLIGGFVILGFGPMTRLTASFDLLAVVAWTCCCLYQLRSCQANWKGRLGRYLLSFSMTSLICVGLDRAYHYYRFGLYSGTYIHLMGERMRNLHKDLPSTFPFSNPFENGFWGAIITPEKSLFLFDPLVILTIYLLIKHWRAIDIQIRTLLIVGAAWLMGYIVFYASYYDWGGDSAWGDRFITTPVQITALFAVPIYLRWRRPLNLTRERPIVLLFILVTVWIQISSVFFSYNLEIIQLQHAPTKIIVLLRQINIAAWLTGNFERWKLSASVPLSYLTPGFAVFWPARNFGPRAALWLKVVWGMGLITNFAMLLWVVRVNSKLISAKTHEVAE